ncbi:hypothetical protein [Catenulispora subtropica]|uniref:Uncharacterized protein n=1 Tax=Catenulispora subtropica TaxID=450798 RepID=A0ABP5DJR2_9ACTN
MSTSYEEFKAKLGEAADKLGDVAKAAWDDLGDAAEKAWNKASDRLKETKGAAAGGPAPDAPPKPAPKPGPPPPKPGPPTPKPGPPPGSAS